MLGAFYGGMGAHGYSGRRRLLRRTNFFTAMNSKKMADKAAKFLEASFSAIILSDTH
jgi:hypothetical protein